jgi:hypothetical protein
LDGKVSDTLIRNCLPEEYKQGYRISNAKKQKKNQKQKEATNLATLVLLNQKKDKKVEEEVEGEEEEEKRKNKDLIAIDVAGRTYIQRDNDAESSKTSDENSILTDKSLRQPFYQLQKEQEQPVEKHSQLVDTSNVLDKMIITELEVSIEHSKDNDKDVMSFEFAINAGNMKNT